MSKKDTTPVTFKEAEKEITLWDELFISYEKDAMDKINEKLKENTDNTILKAVEWIDDDLIIYAIPHQYIINNREYNGIILEKRDLKRDESIFMFLGNPKLVPTIVANLVNNKMQMKY